LSNLETPSGNLLLHDRTRQPFAHLVTSLNTLQMLSRRFLYKTSQGCRQWIAYRWPQKLFPLS